ncbi:ketopantoate reductase family protein [Flagellimonas marina]|uniref:2-dehydropantoate 2-reductase n=1 Tax=Flagellimonas marina TaxID=1775168 RepID=A0ABV8PM22_9FLAO
MEKTNGRIRIGILGLGGTGGFFGGKLAKHYYENEKVDVIFIARNETKEKIQETGLMVESVDGNFNTKPFLVSEDSVEIGDLDILLVCVKSYSMAQAVGSYGQNVKKGGAVITIQNILDQAERIKGLLPKNTVHLQGCAYIISNIAAPGHIKHKGGPATLFFGDNSNISRYGWILDLFIDAGIKATLSNSISEVIWKKFLFISPLAVATSYFSCDIGTLRTDESKLSFLRGLMNELLALARIKNINLVHKDMAEHLMILERFPPEGKTSTQLDIESKRKSELDALLGHVLAESKRNNLESPHYQRAYEKLISSNN